MRSMFSILLLFAHVSRYSNNSSYDQCMCTIRHAHNLDIIAAYHGVYAGFPVGLKTGWKFFENWVDMWTSHMNNYYSSNVRRLFHQGGSRNIEQAIGWSLRYVSTCRCGGNEEVEKLKPREIELCE